MDSVIRHADGDSPGGVSSKPAKILALDYGRRRIGLAISDSLGLTAHPLAALERKNRRDDLRKLREIAKEHRVAQILVGLPLHLSGRSGKMASEAEQFAARVEKILRLPVIMRDERLTSWEAAKFVRESKTKKDEYVDSLSAAIILREYLEETPNREGLARTGDT